MVRCNTYYCSIPPSHTHSRHCRSRHIHCTHPLPSACPTLTSACPIPPLPTTSSPSLPLTQITQSEAVTFTLSGGLERILTVQVWTTNQTHHFVSQGNRTVTDSKLEIQVEKDSIVTISSWFNGQKKGRPSVPVPAATPFPLPHSDDFDAYAVDAQARFFADNGGSFQVAPPPVHAALDRNGGARGKVLKQWVVNENGVNRWGRNVNPITVIGNATWVNVTATVDVLIGAGSPPPPPPPKPSGGFYHWQNGYTGECLDLESNSRSPGSRVDVWTCVSADNEQFNYDPATGHLIEKTTKDCVSAGPCDAGADLCIVPCAKAVAANATWDVDYEAGTIKPRGVGDQCLQTASKILDASVFLGKDVCV